MSELAPEGQGNVEGTQGTQEVAPPESTGTPNINPAWEELLGVVPSQLHSQVTPHLQKWDQNYQKSINEVHSQYEPYKPFLEAGYQPDDINFGINLAQAIAQNPQQVAQALNEWIQAEYGEEEQQGQNESTPQFDPNTPDFDITQHPAFQQQDQALRAMAEILLEQREQEQQAQADQELEQEISSLQEKFKDRGEFDLEFVLGVAMNDPDMDLEKAGEKFYERRDAMLQQVRKPGPPVLGSGGTIPSGGFDPRKLDDKSRRALVAQMLQQAKQQS